MVLRVRQGSFITEAYYIDLQKQLLFLNISTGLEVEAMPYVHTHI